MQRLDDLINCFTTALRVAKDNLVNTLTGGSCLDTSSSYNIQRRGANNQHIYFIPKEKHTHTMIWLPGMGDSAEESVGIFHNDLANLVTPSTKVVLLSAPERSMTINAGQAMSSWFDFQDLDAELEEFKEAVSVADIKDSQRIVKQIIDEEVEILKGDSTKLFIGGFS